MLRYCVVVLCFFCGIIHSQIASKVSEIIISEKQSENAFPVFLGSKVTSLVCIINEDAGIKRAVNDLKQDVERVSGYKPEIKNHITSEQYQIIIGTIGKSKYIDQLVAEKKINAKDLKNKWESFVITTIELPNKNKQLIIAGSDRRGTIYGIYELSEKLGVSPWYWWADVPVIKRQNACVAHGYFASGEPKVKYRGIFINDEIPTMSSWAKAKFGGMNSKMYANVFELLLRLRANYLWPAMWGSFKEYKPLVTELKDEQGNYLGNCFNEDDPENASLANEYGIIMGTSHHEPMQRSQQEWMRNKEKYGNGEWNYMTNKEGIQKFFQEGMNNTKNFESIITLGMRGDEDKPMVDAGSIEANFEILEGIIKDQRKIISDVTKKPVNKTPQVWTLYKEVMEYFDLGLKVPDDVIVLLCDDDWGHVRRLPEIDAKKRHTGGYGMYYHLGYYGAPRASKWLNNTQIQQMWEQLQLTYDYGVDKIWMLNVGHLKPNEYPIDFFMKMAWNPKRFTADNIKSYTHDFCKQQFGENQAAEAARILEKYCKYSSRVVPELLDENSYNLESGEYKHVRDEFLALEAEALRQYLLLSKEYKDAYKQLVLYPVQALANVYDMYYSLAMNTKLAQEKDRKANIWADRVEDCFKRDVALTADFDKINNGKWNHIINQVHIGYKSWFPPQFNTMPQVFRVLPEEEKKGGYIFDEKNGVVVIEGEHYFAKKASQNTQWTVIPDFGKNLSGIALMPYTDKTGGAMLTYKLRLKGNPSSVKVHFFFGVTLPFKKDGHSIEAFFDEKDKRIISINQDLTWKNNYSKMYPTAAERMIEKEEIFTLSSVQDKVLTLNIKPLDPAIVLCKIVIDNGGYEETRLKMLETPYSKY